MVEEIECVPVIHCEYIDYVYVWALLQLLIVCYNIVTVIIYKPAYI